jgi:hypothetical protein
MTPSFRDYSLIQRRVQDVLSPLDPQDFVTIDQLLNDITGAPVSLSVSNSVSASAVLF